MDIAVITARGGSKRIPRKNIRPFCGKPMIAWPIEAAKASGCFAHILVSTDDEEIAEISKQYGAEVPFLRPAELADDYSPAHKSAEHALHWALQEWGEIKAFCHLYPTSPLLTGEHIKSGRAYLQQGAKRALTAYPITFPVYQVLQKYGEGYARLFDREKVSMRSQDMPQTYIDAGQMYWFDTGYFLKNGTVIDEYTRLVLLPAHEAVDIDTESDWIFAEKLASIRENHFDA